MHQRRLADTKLYCLVTGHVYEQVACGPHRYITTQQRSSNTATVKQEAPPAEKPRDVQC